MNCYLCKREIKDNKTGKIAIHDCHNHLEHNAHDGVKSVDSHSICQICIDKFFKLINTIKGN